MLPRRRAGDVAIAEADRARRRLAQPDDQFDELILAVAGDAGDAEDLAGPDLEVDASDYLIATVVEDVEPADREDRRGRMRFAPVDRELDAPDRP